MAETAALGHFAGSESARVPPNIC